MNINGITDNLSIKIFTPKTPWEIIRSMPTGGELIVNLMLDSINKTSAQAAKPSGNHEIDIIV